MEGAAAILRSLTLGILFLGSLATTSSPHKSPVDVAPEAGGGGKAPMCEMGYALTFPTWNIMCAGGATECVSVSVTGTALGSNGTCPVSSCKGPTFSITITYNGCPAPIANCCPMGAEVIPGPVPLPIHTAVMFSVGGDKPSCGGLFNNDFIIQCVGGGTLMHARLTTQCAEC